MSQHEAPQCEGIIPAHIEAGPLEEQEVRPGKFRRVQTEIEVPEQRCIAPGTALQQSLKEVQKKLGVGFRVTEEHYFCGLHFQSGTIKHLDGTTSEHPSMYYLDGKRFQE